MGDSGRIVVTASGRWGIGLAREILVVHLLQRTGCCEDGGINWKTARVNTLRELVNHTLNISYLKVILTNQLGLQSSCTDHSNHCRLVFVAVKTVVGVAPC